MKKYEKKKKKKGRDIWSSNLFYFNSIKRVK